MHQELTREGHMTLGGFSDPWRQGLKRGFLEKPPGVQEAAQRPPREILG